ncbi:hypothetical protein LNP20_26245 [Klebsiella pneumoniae subsp. pneumoniae]|nr:hypothetical protein [Klebsiella pneumoniae subsp. pneumoniae]
MSVFQSFGPSESNGRKVDYSTFLQEVNQGPGSRSAYQRT